MKNTIGIVTGKDFYGRQNVIKHIYRFLNDGNHIFIAAPRRVGKTCIMHQMMTHPEPGFVFVYVITSSVQDEEEFYKRLLEEIFKSEAIGSLRKKLNKVENLCVDIFNGIGGLELFGAKLELNKGTTNYRAAFQKLIEKLDADENTVVIMIDEYPDMLLNIGEKHNKNAVRVFLEGCWDDRHRAKTKKNIRFIYTGSVGLPTVVSQLAGSKEIADLATITVPPFSKKEARDFLTILFRDYKVTHQPDVIDHLLDKIQWLIPFHLKLAFNEIIDVFEQVNRPIESKDIDLAFKQLLLWRNKIYFKHYEERLEKQPESIHLLNFMAEQNGTTFSKVNDFATEKGLTEKMVSDYMQMLVFDGYVDEDEDGYYRFTSSLLREWWLKYVCKINTANNRQVKEGEDS